jgi:hypothetical protein
MPPLRSFDVKICTVTSRISSVVALQTFLDSRVLSTSSIYLAEPGTSRKLVGGATWTAPNRQLRQDLVGGVAVCFDDHPSAWQNHPRHHTAVGPSGFSAVYW